MKSMIRSGLQRVAPGAYRHFRRRALSRTLLTHPDSFLVTTGYLRSFDTWEARSADGQAVPWMSYAMIALLDERLDAGHTLFEFGSGFSTRFFAERVGRVVSVEYDPQWFERVRAELPGHCTLIQQAEDTDGDFCRVASRQGVDFDVIVVDGRDRVNCVKQSVDHLSPAGVMLLDDSDRPKYQPALQVMAERGFRTLHLPSLAPLEFRTHRTSVFYRDGNCLGL